MKRLLLVLAIIAASFTAKSQDFSGTLVTGSLNFASKKLKQNNTNVLEANSFTINPSIAFFQRNNLAIGLTASYSYSDNLNPADDPAVGDMVGNIKLLGVGPVLRKYFLLDEQAAIFLHSSAMYMNGKQEVEVGGSNYIEIDLRGALVNFSPGFTFLISPKVGIEVSMGGLSYQFLSQGSQGNKAKSSTFDLDLGLASTQVGVSFYLNKKTAEAAN